MRKKYHELVFGEKIFSYKYWLLFSHNPCINCIDSVFIRKISIKYHQRKVYKVKDLR